MEFKEKLKEYIDVINSYIKKEFIVDDSYESKLKEAMSYAMISSAKRLRPILMIATYKLFREDVKECIPFAIAEEMIHNFSLIHDDLPAIDNDDFRHSKPTLHKAFGESTAILAGDSLLNNAYLNISKSMLNGKNIDNKIIAFNELANATWKMCIGEFVDIEWENTKINSEKLEYMHLNKTGALICAAVRIGAILASATKDEIEDLTKYAKKIGLAFQIKDDILSEEGDYKVTGKPVGNDKKKHKSTYISNYGLDKSKEMLDSLIQDACNILDKYGKKAIFLQQLAMYIKNRNK